MNKRLQHSHAYFRLVYVKKDSIYLWNTINTNHIAETSNNGVLMVMDYH